MTLDFADRVMDTLKPHWTVLVIGSSQENSGDYGQYLQQDSASAYQVLTEPCSAQVPSLLQSQQIDGILLVDYSSPSGYYRLLHRLQRQVGENSPPVVVVGSDSVEAAVQTLKAGAADYLVADRTTPDHLRLSLRAAIENAELKRQRSQNQGQSQNGDRQRPAAEQGGAVAAPPQEQHRLQRLIDTAPIGISISTASGNVKVINDAMLQLYGYTRTEFEQRGLNWRDFALPESCDRTEQAVAQLRQQGQLLPEVKEIQRRNGTRVPVWISVMRWLDGTNEQVAFAVDLTQQKQTEAELQGSQQRYRDLAEAMPQMVWTADATGAIDYWNQRWYEYTGLDEVASMGLGGASTVHPEERDRTLATWGQAVTRGEIFEIEYRIRRWDGVYHWFICRGLPTRGRQGQITGWIGTITDIDAIKRSESRIRQGEAQLHQQLAEIEAIYRTAPIGLNVLDRDLRFVRINQKLAEINGLPVEAHIGRTVRELLPDLADAAEQLLRPILETGEPLLNVELHGETPAQPGVKRTWLEHFLPLRDGDCIIGISTVCEEITERKRAELALREAHIQLEAALAAAAVYTWRWRVPDNLVITDRNFAQLFGVDPEGAAVGLPIEQFFNAIHPEDRERVTRAIQAAIATGEDYVSEYRICNAAGEERWVLARGRAEYDDTGNVIAFPGALADITSRKQIEADLRQNAARLQFILATSELGTWEVDLQTQPYMAEPRSPRHDQIYGYETPPTAWSYDTFISHIHPGDRPLVEAKFLQTINTQTDWDVECRIIRADGMQRWVWISGSIYRNREGRATRLMGLIADITDRKQAEIFLRESQAQLQQQLAEIEAIYQSAPIGLGVLDAALRFVRLNQRLADINGLPIEAHIGHTPQELLPDLAEAADRYLYHVLETGEPLSNVEIHGETPAQPGVKRTWLEHFFPLKQGDRIVGINIVCEEITERIRAEAALRQSEARFRTLADNISQLAWMADEHGSIFWYNRRWFDYTGTTLEDMQGWGWRSVHHPNHVSRVVEKINHCFATGELWEDTFPLRGRDGQYRWFLSRAIPIRDEQGRVLRWFGTNTDITDRQRAEEALAQRAQELTQLNQALKTTAADLNQRNQDLNQFAYVVSHDLKAPLRGIRNLSEWLQDDLGDQIPLDNREQLRLLVSRVDRMEALINDLLDYSRAGRVKQPPEHIEVGELVADVLDTLAVPPQVTVRVATPLPTLEARRLMLSQVFVNLVGNAIKYGCADERGEVAISAQEQGDFYEFAIADQGPGIDPIYHEKIFGIFETLQKADRTENTGIGLAIVKRLVEAEGGTVRLESAVGAGTTFYFTWPKQVPAIPEVAPPTGDGDGPG